MKTLLKLAIPAILIFFAWKWWTGKKQKNVSSDLPPSIPNRGKKYIKLSSREQQKMAKRASQILPIAVVNSKQKNDFLSMLLNLQKESLQGIASQFLLSFSPMGKALSQVVAETIGADNNLKSKVVSTLEKIT